MRDIHIGTVLGPVKTVRKILATDGESILFYRKELDCGGQSFLLPSGSIMMPGHFGGWQIYDLTADGLRQNTEVSYRSIHDYNKVIGLWDEYALISSDNSIMGCLYNYKRNETVFSFPLPGGVSHAECLGRTIYFTKADNSGLIAAQLHGV